MTRTPTQSPTDSGSRLVDVLELSDEQVAYYRRVLEVHGLADGLCRVCHSLRCPDWVDAFDKLAAARKLMADRPHESYPTARRVAHRSI